MNDMNEMKYSMNLLRQLATEKAASDHPKELIDLVDHISIFVGHGFRAYALSFSELGDDLTQWRAYAGGVGGYSIGFDIRSEKFPSLIAVSDFDDMDILVPLIYNPKIQLRLLSQLLDLIVEQLHKLKHEVYRGGGYTTWDFESGILSDYTDHVIPTVLDYLLRIKSPEFRSEREWRIITYVIDPDAKDPTGSLYHPRSYRIARGILKAYIEHPVRREEPCGPQQLPIKGIVIGPTSEPQTARSAIEECLTAFGYEGVKISASQVPLRF